MAAIHVDLEARGLGDGAIPWWAVSVLQYQPGTDHYRIRRLLQNGHSRYIKTDAVAGLWQEVVDDARRLEDKVSRQDFVVAQRDLARKGALTSTRAFYEFCQILDDTGRVPILKDFQIRGINAMRRSVHSLELWPFSFGKLVCSSTPVPTPHGYRKHGDLRPGDEVFGPDGKPVRVLGVSADGEASLRVTFTDGEFVDVHPRHEWQVWDRSSQRYRVMETQAIAKQQYVTGGRPRFHVDRTKPLDPPSQPLPVDPYTLGYWLGDGSSHMGAITHSPRDLPVVAYQQSWQATHATTGVLTTGYHGLKDDLKALTVLNNKHVPEAYLWGSYQQRWDLLCGLIDSDGYVGKLNVTFVNTNLELIEAVEHLCRSFGYRPRRTWQLPTTSSSGIVGRKTVYTVSFVPHDGRIPARLERKRGYVAGPKAHRKRAIASIKPIDPVPGQCITVDREDGLYLVGRGMIPTHNSWHSSVTVPLMDWAENPEFTECRIYFNPKFVKTWTRTLMYIVEHNQALHSLFPWVARPDTEDPCFDIWSLDGFCIKGKSAPIGYSWEALTVNAGITGRRYWRTGCDDWVVSDNAKSEAVQDAMWEYFFTGPMTFQKPVPFNSHYETKASTIFVVGTLFDRRDFGYRLMQKWRQQKYPVHKVDVYTDDSETTVIWPEERPATWVQEQRENLDPAQFNARVRNRILATDQEAFTEEMVAGALDKTLNFGEVPRGANEVWIGFDPASGKRGKYSKYPAMALLAFQGDLIHLVKWARWPYPMPRQVQELVDHARLYQCPVAVEDSSQQIAYRHWIAQQDPSVRVINHVTNATTKRDWKQGVESLIPYFQAGNFIIHAGNATNQEVNDLKKELLEYPQSKTTDILMAIWIAKYQQYLHQSRQVSTGRPDIPTYIRSRGYHTQVLDLKALREGRTSTVGRRLCPHCEKLRCICPPGTVIVA